MSLSTNYKWPTNLSWWGLNPSDVQKIENFIASQQAPFSGKIKYSKDLPRSLYFQNDKIFVLIKSKGNWAPTKGASTQVKVAYEITSGTPIADKRFGIWYYPVHVSQRYWIHLDYYLVRQILPRIQGRGVAEFIGCKQDGAKSFLYERLYDDKLNIYITSRTFSVEEKIKMIGDLLYGIDRIHQINCTILDQNFPLAHGDIKPDNVLVDRNTSNLFLTDFGSMCCVDGYLTTPIFNSPGGVMRQAIPRELVTKVQRCDDLAKNGQKRDMWGIGILIGLILNKNGLNFLSDRITNETSADIRKLDLVFKTLTQNEINNEIDREVESSSDHRIAKLWNLLRMLFTIEDQQRLTAAESLKWYKDTFEIVLQL